MCFVLDVEHIILMELLQCTFCGQDFTSEQSFKNKVPTKLQSIQDAPFKKGDRIADRYVITRFFEKFSCNYLFQVKDEETDNTLFLRIIAKNLLQRADDKENFRQAFKSARRLKHNNIIQLLDFGEHQGYHFYTSKHFQGLSLKRIIRLRHQKGEGFSSEELLPIFQQIFEALKYAHKLNWHGGLSPEDIIILPDLLKIINFQQIHSLPLKPFLNVIKTSTEQFHYLAPELRIEATHIDHRVDIYSLGVILVEILTGLKYQGQLTEELTLALQGIPRNLEIIIRKAVSEHPDARYKSIAQMWAALEPALNSMRKSIQPYRPKNEGKQPPPPMTTEVIATPKLENALLEEVSASQVQLLNAEVPPPFPVEDFEENSNSFAIRPMTQGEPPSFKQMTNVSETCDTPLVSDVNIDSPPPLPKQEISESALLAPAPHTPPPLTTTINQDQESEREWVSIALFSSLAVIILLLILNLLSLNRHMFSTSKSTQNTENLQDDANHIHSKSSNSIQSTIDPKEQISKEKQNTSGKNKINTIKAQDVVQKSSLSEKDVHTTKQKNAAKTTEQPKKLRESKSATNITKAQKNPVQPSGTAAKQDTPP